MDLNQIAASAVGSSPVAALLWMWLTAERKERREVQQQLVSLTERMATFSEKTADRLDRLEKAGA